MKLDKKRKQQRKTNYGKRLILLKGGCLRLVVRKTNRYIIMQIIESKNAQDSVRYAVNTKELLEYGWPENKKGSLKSLSASYLGGLLLGKKTKNIKKVILDTGLIPNTKGSRVYAVVKGVADSGININHNKKVIPSEERIKQNITEFDKIKEAIEKTNPKNKEDAKNIEKKKSMIKIISSENSISSSDKTSNSKYKEKK